LHELSRCWGFSSRRSVCESLSADLSEALLGVRGTELESKLLSLAQSVLELSILASSYITIFVIVEYTENVINVLHAALVVSHFDNEWECCRVVVTIEVTIQVAYELIVEFRVLQHENVAAKGNGGEDEQTVEMSCEVIDNVVLGGGAGGVNIARVALFVSLTIGLIIVLIEEKNHIVGDFGECYARDHSRDACEPREEEVLDALFPVEGILSALHCGCSLCESVVEEFPLVGSCDEGENGGHKTPEEEGDDGKDFVEEHLISEGGVVCVFKIKTICE